MLSESDVSCQVDKLQAAIMSLSEFTTTSKEDTKTLNFLDFSMVQKVSLPENTWKSLKKKLTISKTEVALT